MDEKKIPEEMAEDVVIEKAKLYLSRLKKIINKRPMSDVKNAKEKYEEYKRLGLSKGKYRNENEMLVYFIYNRTGKYYDVSKFFEKNIPTYLQDMQKVADEAYMPNVIPKLERKVLEAIMAADNIELKGELIQTRYGYEVPQEFLYEARQACIWYDAKTHVIRGYDLLAEMKRAV